MRLFSVMCDLLSPPFCSMTLQSEFKHRLIKKIVGYVFYGCIAFSLFLGIHLFEDKMERIFCEVLSGVSVVQIKPEGVRLSLLPPKLQVDALSLCDSKTGGLLYALQRIKVTPELIPLLSGRVKFNATSASYGGGINATVVSGALFDFDYVDVALDIVNQSLHRVPFLIALDQRLKGTGSVSLSATGSLMDMRDWHGTISFDGKNVQVSNSVPIVKMSTFEKVTLAGSLQFDGSKVDIDEVSVAGDHLTGTVKGTAYLNAGNWSQSEIALSSSVHIPPEKLVTTFIDDRVLAALRTGKKAVIRIHGDISHPVFSLN